MPPATQAASPWHTPQAHSRLRSCPLKARRRASLSRIRGPPRAVRAAAAPRGAPAADADDVDDDAGVWDAPLEELWSGWEDPSPENFLAVLLLAVLVGSLALVSLRILVVLCAIFFAAAKYTAVALLLALFGVFFA